MAFDSSDPYSSPPAGRITVTVASTAPPSYSLTPLACSSQNDPDVLALARLLIQYSGGVRSNGSNFKSVGGGGREDCWSEGATAVLIDAWGERYLKLSRGNLKQKHWKEVAEIVSSREDYGKPLKTDIQCKNRIDTVKKKYKQEKVKLASGGGRSRWVFFEKLDRLIGSTSKIPTASPGISGGGSPGGGLHKIPMSSRSNLYHQQAKAATSSFHNLDRLIEATSRGLAASYSGNGEGGSVNVPMGSPMSSCSNPYEHERMMEKTCSESKRRRFKKRNTSDSNSESEAVDSVDSLASPKRKRTDDEKKKRDGDIAANNWRELTRVMMRFGEVYEQTENAKLQQMIVIEKEKMEFFKELELQRMQFTQLKIS